MSIEETKTDLIEFTMGELVTMFMKSCKATNPGAGSVSFGDTEGHHIIVASWDPARTSVLEQAIRKEIGPSVGRDPILDKMSARIKELEAHIDMLTGKATGGATVPAPHALVYGHPLAYEDAVRTVAALYETFYMEDGEYDVDKDVNGGDLVEFVGNALDSLGLDEAPIKGAPPIVHIGVDTAKPECM